MPSVKARPSTPTLVARWQADVADFVTDARWSRTGALVAAACADGTVVVLDGTTGAVRHRLSGHAGGALAVSWSAPRVGRGADGAALPDGVLASAGQDGCVRLWNADTGACLAELDAAGVETTSHGNGRRMMPWAEHLVWSPDGTRLATAAGREVRVWDAEGRLVRRHPPLASTVSALAWRQESRHSGDARLSAAAYGGVMLYAAEPAEAGQPDARESGAAEHRFDWRGSFLAMAWSPHGRVLAAGMQESAIHVWTAAQSGTAPREGAGAAYVDLEMSGYPTKVRELAWSSDGKLLATGGGQEVTVWSFAGKGPAGTRPRQLRGHLLQVRDLDFRGRGSLLASGGDDGQLLVWDLARPIDAPSGASFFSGGVSRVAWHPQERIALGASASGRISACGLPR